MANTAPPGSSPSPGPKASTTSNTILAATLGSSPRPLAKDPITTARVAQGSSPPPRPKAPSTTIAAGSGPSSRSGAQAPVMTTAVAPDSSPQAGESYQDFVKRMWPNARILARESPDIEPDYWRGRRPFGPHPEGNVKLVHSAFTVIDFRTSAEPRIFSGFLEQKLGFAAYFQGLHDFIRATPTLSQGLVIHWQRRSWAHGYKAYLRVILATLADAVFANPDVVQSLELWLYEQVELDNKMGPQQDNCLRLWTSCMIRKGRFEARLRVALPSIELPVSNTILVDLSSCNMLHACTIPLCELHL